MPFRARIIAAAAFASAGILLAPGRAGRHAPRSGNRREAEVHACDSISPQLAACLTSLAILSSTAAVSLFRA